MARGKTPSAAKGGTSPGGGGKRAAEGVGPYEGKKRDRRGDEIQVVGFLIQEDGSTVPMEDLTPEQREAWKESCCKRLSQRLSDYFTQHPEEYARV